MAKVSVANFNLVFYGNGDEEPLLNYFDTIVMPAFTEGIIKGGKKEEDNKFFFMNVRVEKTESNEHVLRGILVKKTVLEVKSDIDENGNLIEKDDKYPAAPYSMFVIYLRNHRMVYYENQKGSPNLSSFRATAKYVIEEYLRRKKKLDEMEDLELPIPVLNVVGIPMRKNMEEALKDVYKINTLCLRFFPLNGDIDYAGAIGIISTELRKAMDASNGEIMIRSPKNVPGVIDVVGKSGGTVEPIFKVSYIDNSTGRKRKGTIKGDTISETMQWETEKKDDINREFSEIINRGEQLPSITYTSRNNNNIYERNLKKIVPFVKK